MFLLKKILGPLLYPHTVFLALLVCGVLVLWLTSKRKLGRVLVTLGAAGFLLLSYPIVWNGLLLGMEDRYPPLDLHQADLSGIQWVVVLGGGGTADDRLPATSQMSPASEARLVEGIRILRSIPQAKLLLSGDFEAILMHDAARSLGVNPDQMLTDEESRDTAEQAVTVKGLVKGDRLVLVTSAVHLPRAMALFQKQGMNPVPAPADFLARVRPR